MLYLLALIASAGALTYQAPQTCPTANDPCNSGSEIVYPQHPSSPQCWKNSKGWKCMDLGYQKECPVEYIDIKQNCEYALTKPDCPSQRDYCTKSDIHLTIRSYEENNCWFKATDNFWMCSNNSACEEQLGFIDVSNCPKY
ncbi:hypothetical protein DSO57_1028902 [Entomophthora muscae]|uniref:Uncharacterized protein n=1 Tax=Entomophthora muscae TaxID=34485 RepID=A0ACC2TZW1_9FUNG|nr:hypothetical protein DSO57_1028902 [Entomophthora muscae]